MRQLTTVESTRKQGLMSTGFGMHPCRMVEAMEPTYTPTTYRISKAKKGKRVHACNQCNKVCDPFTSWSDPLKLPSLKVEPRSSPGPSISGSSWSPGLLHVVWMPHLTSRSGDIN